MAKRNTYVIVNLESKKMEREIEEVKENLKRYHKRINYHLTQIDKQLGYIDDLMGWGDGEFEDNWLEE